MSDVEDPDLGRRLQALRAEPPDAVVFERSLGVRLRLAQGLPSSPESSDAPAADSKAVGARVITGPWPKRRLAGVLVGAALLAAGAAAALEAGVIDWLEARLQPSDAGQQRPDNAASKVVVGSVREGQRAGVLRLENAVPPNESPVSDPSLVVPRLKVESRAAAEPSPRPPTGVPRLDLGRPSAGAVLRRRPLLRASPPSVDVPRVEVDPLPRLPAVEMGRDGVSAAERVPRLELAPHGFARDNDRSRGGTRPSRSRAGQRERLRERRERAEERRERVEERRDQRLERGRRERLPR